MNLKVMQYNTLSCSNYKTLKVDFPCIAEAIKKYDPDILGLNEIRDEGESVEYDAQLRILSSMLGFKYFYFAKAIDDNGPNPYGNGLMSKYPIIEVDTVMIPDPEEKKYEGFYETRCVLKAVVNAGKKIDVVVTHFGLNPDEQENAVKTVLDNISDTNCILMGDFNVVPDNEVLNPIREKMVDTAKLFDGERLSFPSDVPDRKIDYIFTSPDIEVLKADIPEIIASDHRPHIAEIEI